MSLVHTIMQIKSLSQDLHRVWFGIYKSINVTSNPPIHSQATDLFINHWQWTLLFIIKYYVHINLSKKYIYKLFLLCYLCNMM